MLDGDEGGHFHGAKWFTSVKRKTLKLIIIWQCDFSLTLFFNVRYKKVHKLVYYTKQGMNSGLFITHIAE